MKYLCPFLRHLCVAHPLVVLPPLLLAFVLVPAPPLPVPHVVVPLLSPNTNIQIMSGFAHE